MSARHARLAAGISAALLVACAAPLDQRFAAIQAGFLEGTPRDQVMALMGLPNRVRSLDLAGLQAECAEWADRQAAYTVCFFRGRAVLKRARPAHPATTQEV